MTLLITVTRNRAASPDGKVGVSFGKSKDTDCVEIAKVKDDGLFGGSCLETGQRVVSVNGTTVEGMSSQDVLSLMTMTATDGDISIQVEPLSDELYVLEGNVISSVGAQKQKQHVVKLAKQDSKTTPPVLLAVMGVTNEMWKTILHLVERELLPACQQCLTAHSDLAREMKGFASKQMWKGFLGCGCESAHEQHVFILTQEVAMVQSDMNLTATSVLMRVNAMLNPHGLQANWRLHQGPSAPPPPPGKSAQAATRPVRVPTSLVFSAIVGFPTTAIMTANNHSPDGTTVTTTTEAHVASSSPPPESAPAANKVKRSGRSKSPKRNNNGNTRSASPKRGA